MKNLILSATCALSLAACASTLYMVETEGAFMRTTTRVIERHDAFVQADESLFSPDKAEYLSDSADLFALIQLPAVSALILEDALEPVADRHDAYVIELETDVLVRDIFLEDTARLRSLLAEAASHEPDE